MNELSLFTGCGGGVLASKLLGHWVVGYVEIDEFCQKLLRRRIDDGLIDNAPIFSDIRAFNSEGYAASYTGMVDIVSGGFPCQDISNAGKKAGIEGEKSGLWFEMAKTIGIIRPRYVFVENVPALLTKGIDAVLGALAEMGYDAKWGCFSAGELGAFHKRERIFCLANGDGKLGAKRYWFKFKRKLFEDECFRNSKSSQDFERAFIQMAKKHARMDDGIPYPVDSVKALGNAQVPIVAATAWKILGGL